MKPAKEMLAISESVNKERADHLWGEREIMELIACEAAKGETSIYVNFSGGKELIEKLEEHGYEVSPATYVDEDTGMFDLRRISWRQED